MKYRMEIQNDTGYLTLSGQLRFESNYLFLDHFHEILDKVQVKNIVIDLSEGTQIDASSFGLLMVANKQTKKHQKSLKIVGAKGQIKKRIRLMGLDATSPFEEDQDGSIAA